MGTHPIFESDFDCLTDSTGLINQNGSYLINRWRYYEALSLKDVQPTCTTQTHQDCYQGRKEGSWRRLRKTNRWCQEWWLQKGRCRQTTKILPNSFHQKMHRLCMHCYFNQARHLWCFCSRTCQRCLLQESCRSKED